MSKCINNNGDSVLHMCFKYPNNSLIYNFSYFLNQFINPRLFAISTTFFILILPFLFLLETPISIIKRQIEKYSKIKIETLHYLHRIIFSLVLNVVLYTVFRQRRPCSCIGENGEYEHLGSSYGLPSGDVLNATLFSIFFIEIFGKKRIIPQLFAFVLLIFIIVERMTLGFHSLFQTLSGSFLGIILHFYTINVPQYFIFIDLFIQV
eukprot:gene7642-11964_t